jgi:16S rRNA (guanine527-N7)-methyltransferase
VTTREFNQRLLRRARKVGVPVSPALAAQLEAYYRLLDLWNAKINLTALPLKDGSDEAVDRLLVEPLVAARHIPWPDAHVMDIGSGGGSPALPIKAALPGVSMRLVESKVRKSAFLREAIRTMKLSNVEVETARFEELLTRPELHEAAEVITLRAVRVEVRQLMNLQAFLRPGGLLFLFRGPTGPDVPATLTPPLLWHATHQLVDSSHSRLVILRKQPVGYQNQSTVGS